MAAIVMLPVELGDLLLNKTPNSPIVPLLPDHSGPDIPDRSLDQETGADDRYTNKEPISTASPSVPDSSFMRVSASHRARLMCALGIDQGDTGDMGKCEHKYGE